VPINVVAVLYEVFSTVISFFPLFAKVDAKSMNWGRFAGLERIFLLRSIADLDLSVQVLLCLAAWPSSASLTTSCTPGRSTAVRLCT